MPPGINSMIDRMRSTLIALEADASGATAIEYALIAAGISIAIAAAVQAWVVSVTGKFTAILAGLESMKPYIHPKRVAARSPVFGLRRVFACHRTLYLDSVTRLQ